MFKKYILVLAVIMCGSTMVNAMGSGNGSGSGCSGQDKGGGNGEGSGDWAASDYSGSRK